MSKTTTMPNIRKMFIPDPVLLDDDDVDNVVVYAQHKNLPWSIFQVRRRLYVRCGRQLLHRFLMNVTDPDLIIHHKNNNGLDNRRSTNLEILTQLQNKQRTKDLLRNNTSGKTGVSWSKQSSKWEAYIKVDGIRIGLGVHSTLDAAIRVREAAEIRYFGAFTNV